MPPSGNDESAWSDAWLDLNCFVETRCPGAESELCCGEYDFSDATEQSVLNRNIFAEELVRAVNVPAPDPFYPYKLTRNGQAAPLIRPPSPTRAASPSRLSRTRDKEELVTPRELFTDDLGYSPRRVVPQQPQVMVATSESTASHASTPSTPWVGLGSASSTGSVTCQTSFRSDLSINPLTGYITLSVKAIEYNPDPSDRMDIELTRTLRYIGVEAAGVIMIRRLLPGRYEIDARRVTVTWGPPGNQSKELFAREEDIRDGDSQPVPLAAYLQQAASVALQISSGPGLLPTTVTFSTYNAAPMVSTLAANGSFCDRVSLMRTAVEQAEIREKTAEFIKHGSAEHKTSNRHGSKESQASSDCYNSAGWPVGGSSIWSGSGGLEPPMRSLFMPAPVLGI